MGEDYYSTYEITSTDAGTKKKIMSKPGILAHITVLTTSAQALTFYDDTNTTSPAQEIGAIKASVLEQTFTLKKAITRGLVVNVPGSYAGSCVVSFEEMQIS